MSLAISGMVGYTVAPRFKNMVPPEGSPVEGSYISLYSILKGRMFLTRCSCGHVLTVALLHIWETNLAPWEQQQNSVMPMDAVQ